MKMRLLAEIPITNINVNIEGIDGGIIIPKGMSLLIESSLYYDYVRIYSFETIEENKTIKDDEP